MFSWTLQIYFHQYVSATHSNSIIDNISFVTYYIFSILFFHSFLSSFSILYSLWSILNLSLALRSNNCWYLSYILTIYDYYLLNSFFTLESFIYLLIIGFLFLDEFFLFSINDYSFGLHPLFFSVPQKDFMKNKHSFLSCFLLLTYFEISSSVLKFLWFQYQL